jgi:hypothetical protein
MTMLPRAVYAGTAAFAALSAEMLMFGNVVTEAAAEASWTYTTAAATASASALRTTTSRFRVVLFRTRAVKRP